MIFPINKFMDDQNLCQAARVGDFSKVVRLVTPGVDIETIDIHGRTPLSLAAANGHLKVVKFLVDHGAEMETKDIHGRPPLFRAVFYGKSDVVEFLEEVIAQRQRQAADIGNLTKSAARR